MVDYRINLAKSLTSTVEERVRFYNGMLIYLVLCSAILVGVVYTSTVNLLGFSENKWARAHLLDSASEKMGVDKAVFKNTDRAYAELQSYSVHLSKLRQALEQQQELLPVVRNLFVDMPKDIVLQSLLADNGRIAFGLTMPPVSTERGDPVRQLKVAWENNEELTKRVSAIRPLTGERRTVGDKSVFYLKFECILKSR